MSFNSAVTFANRWTKCAQFHFRVHDWPRGNLRQRLFENLDALAHLERAHHQPVVSIAVISQRNAEFKSRINSVAVDFANIVVHAARPQHRPGDSPADST